MHNKKGDVLISNVVFIILNLTFLAILIIFIFNKGSGVSDLEQSYAKQIALIVDSAKVGMKINLDISKGKDADEEWFKEHYAEAVKISGNIVTVKLSEESGYSYSFFNDVIPSIDIYPEGKIYIEVRDKNVKT